ncbi:MAG TPA: NrfD/PsrC family molybdoenzyme membrane anchor subunit [Bryobacteraceae bacterium]|nr:NrfD/PsrC family molybdoenzyme membrane anchor subunit [Bryobacteraceae bacterium]
MADNQGYYGIPMLKRPLWRWEIAWYFFLEGISSGAFILSAMARLFGRNRNRGLQRSVRYLSLATLLPCPPLLIADLGRPARFHHMLRVWKRSSPMNTGAWALMGYSVPVALLAFDQLLYGRRDSSRALQRWSAVEMLGLPFAFTMVSYPGVLLSATSTPVWSQSPYLGGLLACSSLSTAASAIALVIGLQTDAGDHAPLQSFEIIAKICEGALTGAYLASSGRAAEPLTRGRYAKHIWIGAMGLGIVLPLAIHMASRRLPKRQRSLSLLSSVCSLAGGFCLKWAIVHSGPVSADDPEAARYASRASTSKQWCKEQLCACLGMSCLANL